ncbi:MAG TPA: ATP-binding protein [Tepidisphaeraceae bacterium]|jgi:serine/threonine-protein kinase RsbW|nr:ATP-binding protein [Tepidisphaeraceae bacterium]
MGNSRSKPRDDQPRKIQGAVASLKFEIDSDLTKQREIQKQILDAVEKAGYTSDNVFAVKISLEEALINAIKHGNKHDQNKKVRVQATVSPEETEITIEDEGPGFERKDVPDPTAEENLLKCSGRGILLIETYMDRVEYSKSGRCLRMIKRNKRSAKQAQ